MIFTLKNLYYLEKLENSDLKYGYDGVNTIIVNEKYSVTTTEGPEVHIYGYPYSTQNYFFDKRGHFLKIQIFDEKIDNFKYVISSKSKKAENYIVRAIRPILDIQPDTELNLQWLFNLIYQGQFD